MPGAMRKLGLYLGLVEDDDDVRDPRDRRYSDDAYADDGYDAPEGHDSYDEPEPAPVRRWSPEDRPVGPRRTVDTAPRTRGSAALDTALRPAPVMEDSYRITTLHPRTYNEARTIGEHFRDGTPVIMNLTEMDDGDAKRLVDFAAGLIFGLRGSIERVTNKVFLLSPEHVEVTAEDKARIAGGGFFNQS
jgi:cell division inhibitor SepF